MSTPAPFATPQKTSWFNQLMPQRGLERTLTGALLAVSLISTTLAGGIVYTHLFRKAVADAKDDLRRHAESRAFRESVVFQDAMLNQAFLRELLLKKLREPIPADIDARFSERVERRPDGALRNRKIGSDGIPFDGKRQAGIFLPKNRPLTPDLMRRMLLGADLCETYGPAWHGRLKNLYIDTPEGAGMLYWPESPDWCENAKADFDQNLEPYELAANARNNPARATVWTTQYFDPPSNAWMMSCVTPVDLDGRQVATIGHDITLTELIDDFLATLLPDTSAMLVRDDGHILVHPESMARIKELNGEFHAHQSGPQLLAAYEASQKLPPTGGVVELPGVDLVIAAARVPAIRASHVAMISRSVIYHRANEGLLGFTALISCIFLAQFLVLVALLRRHIVRPIHGLARAVNHLGATGRTEDLVTPRKNEIGHLAQAFNTMAKSITEQTLELRHQTAELEAIVADRTAELDRARVEAEAASKAKSNFLAHVSHDLRTPLNAIVGFAQILEEDGALPATTRRHAASIHAAGDALLEMVTDVIDITRVETNTLKIAHNTVDIRALAQSLATRFGPLCDQKRLGFRPALDPALPRAIHSDSLRLRQILAALMAHAIAHADRGAIELSWRFLPGASPEEDRMQIDITAPDAPAIPGEERARLFDRKRVGSDMADLRLPLAREIARLMGGDIHIDDAGPGAGFRHTLSLPARRANPSAEPSPTPREFSPLVDSAAAPPVLVVDDIEDNRLVLGHCLQKLGFHDCQFAEDGADALAKLHRQPYGIVITDLTMPRMDGYELLAAMKSTSALRDIPVIAVSAGYLRASPPGEPEFDGFLAKPYRIDSLRHILAERVLRIAEPPALPEPSPAPRAPEPTPESTRRALIVDDDELNREAVSLLLARAGFKVETADDGDTGATRLRRHPFDLVLFDLHMPRLDGIAMLERLRDDHVPLPPAVCISGVVDTTERDRLAALGVTEFLEKPFRADTLRAAAERLCRRPESP